MKHLEIRNFLISLFFNSSDLGFENKKGFFLQFLIDFFPLDPDPWIQNVADPTDPDPKHFRRYKQGKGVS